jgi:YfiH family protein
MKFYKENGISIFFGNAQSCPVERTSPIFNDFCVNLTTKIGCSTIIIQEQVHGVDGRYIDSVSLFSRPISLFESAGDYLITDQPGIGIGVMTADCLPIILFDKRNNIVAAVHAGWQGSFSHIVIKAIEHMLKKHFFHPADLTVYFGACAKVCCYEVQADFVDRLGRLQWKEQALLHHNGKIFFDLSLFNKLQLIGLGIAPKNINMFFNDCTMCTQKYHSRRRNGHARICQATIAWLA